MPYNAINAQVIGEDWSDSNQWESTEDITKLDITVIGVGVLIQWLEGDERAYQTDEKLWVLLRRGFHSIPFESPIRRYRIRQWSGDEHFKKTNPETKQPYVCEVDVRTFT